MPDHLDTLAALTREAERLGYVRGVCEDDGLPWWLGLRDEWVCAETHGDLWLTDGGLYVEDEAAALRWLLRQPEALARAACYARGVADERARVATMLDNMAEAYVAVHYMAGAALRQARDAVRRGDDEVSRG